MKKLILLLALSCLALTGSAQKRLLTNVNPTEAEKQQVEEKKSKEYGNGGVSFMYEAIDDGFGLGIGFNFGGFWLQGDTQSASNDYIEAETWMVKLGYSYRCWLGKHLYLQVPVGVGYGHSTTKFKGTDEKESGGDALLTTRPAIGLRLFKSFCIEAGYNWDFAKFKFDEAHRIDYFCVGITFAI